MDHRTRRHDGVLGVERTNLERAKSVQEPRSVRAGLGLAHGDVAVVADNISAEDTVLAGFRPDRLVAHAYRSPEQV
jgi:hypothetical protein